MMRLSVLLAVAACASEPAGVPGDDAPDGKADGDGHTIAWSVSRHVWPTDSRERITQDLALIAELGASYVRTDFWWYSIEPSRGHYDQPALDFYRWYVEEAQRHHVGVIAIVSGAPDWARALYDSDRAGFVAAFGNYSERVAAGVGDLVHLSAFEALRVEIAKSR